MKQIKEKQIHLRVSEDEKNEILNAAKNNGSSNISKFIIDSLLNTINKKNLKIEKPIVHTFSISPTIDYFINIDNFKCDKLNKFYSSEKNLSIGGRGINTALILNEFNIKNKAIHYSGGFTGEYLYSILEEKEVEQFRIKSSSETRININVSSEENQFSLEQINNPISEYGKESMIKYVELYINEKDIVVVSGSYRTKDTNFIYELLKLLKTKNAKIYLNLPGENLLEIVKEIKPHFIILDKINSHKEIKTQKEILEFMNDFIKNGCQEVAFVDDVNYSFFMNKEDKYLVSTNDDFRLSFVGLRDAFLAGIIANDELGIEEKLKWAASSQKAKSQEQYFTTFKNILKIKKEVILKNI